MAIHVWSTFMHMIVLCFSVRCLPPITKELTAVTNPYGLKDIFISLHSDDPTQSKVSQETREISQTQAEEGTSTMGSDSPDTLALNQHDSSSAGTSTLGALTGGDTRDTSTQTPQHAERVLTAAIEEEICRHISGSGFFAVNYMFPYSPIKHVDVMFKNLPKLARDFFKMRKGNPSQEHRIYIEDRKEPFVEKMFSCLFIEEINTRTARLYYVTDREYNFSKDPHQFIAGRFLAMHDPDDNKKLELMGMAEQGATLKPIDLKQGAALFASLKDKQTDPQIKYTIARLSPRDTARLCASVMSGIRRDFQKKLFFVPAQSRISVYKSQLIRTLEVKGPEEDDETLHMDLGRLMESIACTGTKGETYYVVQGDEQDAVYVANELGYQTWIARVRYFASGIAVLTGEVPLPIPEESSE